MEGEDASEHGAEPAGLRGRRAARHQGATRGQRRARWRAAVVVQTAVRRLLTRHRDGRLRLLTMRRRARAVVVLQCAARVWRAQTAVFYLASFPGCKVFRGDDGRWEVLRPSVRDGVPPLPSEVRELGFLFVSADGWVRPLRAEDFEPDEETPWATPPPREFTDELRRRAAVRGAAGDGDASGDTWRQPTAAEERAARDVCDGAFTERMNRDPRPEVFWALLIAERLSAARADRERAREAERARKLDDVRAARLINELRIGRGMERRRNLEERAESDVGARTELHDEERRAERRRQANERRNAATDRAVDQEGPRRPASGSSFTTLPPPPRDHAPGASRTTPPSSPPLHSA